MSKSRFLLAAVFGAMGAMSLRSAEPGTDGGGVPPAPGTDGAKSAEQIASEQAAAQSLAAEKAAGEKAALKAKEKADKEAKKAADKAAKEAKTKADAEAKAQAKTQTEQARKAEAEAKAKALVDKKAAQETAKLQNKLPTQNDVTRPKAGSITGSVWGAADAITLKKGSAAAIAEVVAALPTVADATVKTQYARWRKFMGITGRVAPVVAAGAAQPPAAGVVPPAPGIGNVPAAPEVPQAPTGEVPAAPVV